MAGRVVALHRVEAPAAEHEAHDSGGLVDAVDALMAAAEAADLGDVVLDVHAALVRKLAVLVDHIGTGAGMTVAESHTCREFRVAFGTLTDEIAARRRR